MFEVLRSLFILLSLASAQAGTLPADHFLYPADTELQMLIGIEPTISPGGAEMVIARCDQGTAKPSDIPICEAASMIRASTIPIAQFPWQKLTAQVVFFGERHFDQESKIFVAQNMNRFRAQGFTIFALEMFNSSQQPLLDQFYEGRLTSEDLQKALKTVWGYNGENYIRMVEAAREQGMRIVGLDIRDSDLSRNFFEAIHQRDRHMAQIIADLIKKNPSERVVVYSGSMHAYKAFSTTEQILSFPALLRKIFSLTTQSIISLAPKERNAFNSIQKALVGIPTPLASVTEAPASYPYADFLLFLR